MNLPRLTLSFVLLCLVGSSTLAQKISFSTNQNPSDVKSTCRRTWYSYSAMKSQACLGATRNHLRRFRHRSLDLALISAHTDRPLLLWPTTIAGIARTDFGFGFFSKRRVVIAYCCAPVPTQLPCGIRGRIAFLISKRMSRQRRVITGTFMNSTGRFTRLISVPIPVSLLAKLSAYSVGLNNFGRRRTNRWTRAEPAGLSSTTCP
jgi:hypothetical protein